MDLLIDTHAVIWFITDDSKDAQFENYKVSLIWDK